MHRHPSFTGERKSGSTPDTIPFEHVRYKEHPTAQKGQSVFMRVLKGATLLSETGAGRIVEISINCTTRNLIYIKRSPSVTSMMKIGGRNIVKNFFYHIEPVWEIIAATIKNKHHE
jgi:hypothetical protein